MKRLFFFLLAVSLVTACASKQPKPSVPGPGIQQGQWETKAVVSDLKANKSHTLDIDILADRAGQMRMEVSATMGVQVASLVLNKDIRYVIYNQKRYFEGRPSENSFLPLMNLPLHPYNLLSILFDAPIRGKGWTCNKDANNLVTDCYHAERGLKVQWEDRTEEGQKKVVITAPEFEMRWLFRPPKTEVQLKEETFHLDPPAEFKIIQLR